jgi:hypothetical protein
MALQLGLTSATSTERRGAWWCVHQAAERDGCSRPHHQARAASLLWLLWWLTLLLLLVR